MLFGKGNLTCYVASLIHQFVMWNLLKINKAWKLKSMNSTLTKLIQGKDNLNNLSGNQKVCLRKVICDLIPWEKKKLYNKIFNNESFISNSFSP
jgi:hypothetical protein